MSTEACIFCRIASGETRTSFLLRGALSVAFLDINPIRPGHALIAPVRHETEFLNLTADEHADILSIAKRIGDAQRQLFAPTRVGLLVAGFDVPHAHLHVVPMHEYHDLTSQALLHGTLKRAESAEMQLVQQKYARYFADQG